MRDKERESESEWERERKKERKKEKEIVKETFLIVILKISCVRKFSSISKYKKKVLKVGIFEIFLNSLQKRKKQWKKKERKRKK